MTGILTTALGLAVFVPMMRFAFRLAWSSTTYLKCRGCWRVRIFPAFHDYYAWSDHDHTGWCPRCYFVDDDERLAA